MIDDIQEVVPESRSGIVGVLFGLIIAVGVMFVVIYLFGQVIQANEIGPEYCQNLVSKEPGFGQSLDATTHFCDYNVSTQGYDFNRTKFIEALSHMES